MGDGERGKCKWLRVRMSGWAASLLIALAALLYAAPAASGPRLGPAPRADLLRGAAERASQVVCGDGFTAGSETCDDGDNYGGDGCAANCTAESSLVVDLGDLSTSQSHVSIQTNLFRLPFAAAGSQILSLGSPRPDAVLGIDGITNFAPGEAPIALRVPENLDAIEPMRLPGLVCACLRRVELRTCGGRSPLVEEHSPTICNDDADVCGEDGPCLPAFGPAVSAAGVLGCDGIAGVNYTAVSDRSEGGSMFSRSGGLVEAGAWLISGTAVGLIMDGGRCDVDPSNPAKGPDGFPCTEDDPPASRGVPALSVLTTGTASASILDANHQPGVNIASGETCGASPCVASATGAAVGCHQLFAGNASGFCLASAHASLAMQAVGDVVVAGLFCGLGSPWTPPPTQASRTPTPTRTPTPPGAPGTATATHPPLPCDGDVCIRLDGGVAPRGGATHMSARLESAVDVAAVLVRFAFDREQYAVPMGADGRPRCSVDPEYATGFVHISYVNDHGPCEPFEICDQVRVASVAASVFPRHAELLRCDIEVAPGAAFGPHPLTIVDLQASDPQRQPLEVLGAEGAIAVVPTDGVLCGDGLSEADEQCDDGNNYGGDGCAANCTAETEMTLFLGDEESSQSKVTVQTVAFDLGLTLTGAEVLARGEARPGFVAGADGLTSFLPGELPVASAIDRNAGLLGPVRVPGLACACIRGAELWTCGGLPALPGDTSAICTPFADSCPPEQPCAPVFGPNVFSAGRFGCEGTSGLDYVSSADGITGTTDFSASGGPVAAGGRLLSYTAVGVIMDSGTCTLDEFDGAKGPDGLPCTDDDPTTSRGTPNLVVRTTGRAQASVSNANHQLGRTIDSSSSCGSRPCVTIATGTAKSCGDLLANDTAGLCLASAYTSLSQPQTGDVVITSVMCGLDQSGLPTPVPTASPSPTVQPPCTQDACIRLEGGSAVAGGSTRLTAVLTTTRDVSTVSVRFGFSAETAVVAKANGRPDCTVNPEINKGQTAFDFRSGGAPCSGGQTCDGVRAIVLAFDNVDAIPSGSELFHCEVVIAPDAPVGSYPLPIFTTSADDLEGATVASGGIGGAIRVVSHPLSTHTATFAPPTWTSTPGPPTRTATPAPPAFTATSTRRPTPSCVGDCDRDNGVSLGEVIDGVRIALGEIQLALCDNFDFDGNGIVTVDELTRGVALHRDACPPLPPPTLTRTRTPNPPTAAPPTWTSTRPLLTATPTSTQPPPATSTRTTKATATATMTPAAPTHTPTSAPPTATVPPFANCVGDCDGDGQVSTIEAFVCQQIASRQAEIDLCVECDGDGNGRVSSAELTAVEQNRDHGCFPTPFATPTRTPASGACVGDCNEDGVVSFGEVATCGQIAVGTQGLEVCRACDVNSDGEVTEEDLEQQLAAFEQGCSGPAATATPAITQVPGVCAGDCNDSLAVTFDEVQTCQQIAAEELPVSACPACDLNHSGAVEPEELAQQALAYQVGCPPSSLPTPTRIAGLCVGDCNDNGTVSMDEITLCEAIAALQQSVTQCDSCDLNGDGSVDGEELAQQRSNAANGCAGPAPTSTPTPPPAVVVCVGDCNGNGAVSADEVDTCRLIAASEAPLGSCPSCDANDNGAVDPFELLNQLSHLNYGCPTAVPTETAVSTETAVPTETPVPTQAPSATEAPS